MVWKGSRQIAQIHQQVLAGHHVTPHLATTETPFFLVYGRDSSLPIQQLLEPTEWLLNDPYSGCLPLKSHHITLAIAKKTLDGKKVSTHTKDNEPDPT